MADQYPVTGVPHSGVAASAPAPLAVHTHVQGQAAGESNFNDATGKYKLVLGGVFAAGARVCDVY